MGLVSSAGADLQAGGAQDQQVHGLGGWPGVGLGGCGECCAADDRPEVDHQVLRGGLWQGELPRWPQGLVSLSEWP